MIKSESAAGMAILVVTIVLLLVATVVVTLTSRYILLGHAISVNRYQSQQAFAAAEAGLEHGIAHLGANRETIIQDADADGAIDPYTNLQNIGLPNGGSYSIDYANLLPYNFEIIRVQSLGLGSDSITQRIIRQLVALLPIVNTAAVDNPLIVKGDLTLSGNGFVKNQSGLTSVKSGGDVSLEGTAETMATDGSQTIVSSPGALNTDISQNIYTLADMTPDNFFQTFFGISLTGIKNNADYSYQGGGNYNTQLNGKQGKIIYIDAQGETVQLNAGVTVGSADNPVLLVILNGPLVINGGATIYGFVYVGNDINVTANGNASVYGALIIAGNTEVTGTLDLIYDTSYNVNFQNALIKTHKVPGSWSDL